MIMTSKKTGAPRIHKAGAGKFAEAPVVGKYRQALLTRLSEKHEAVAEFFKASAALKKVTPEVSVALQNLRDEIELYIDKQLSAKANLSESAVRKIRESVLDEIYGFGPLGMVLRRPDVGNVYIEGSERAFIEICPTSGKQSKLQQIRLPFRDENHVLDVIHRIISPFDLGLSDETPQVSGSLPNGSRFFASMAPATVHGPTLTLVCQEHCNSPAVLGWHLNYRAGDAEPHVESVQTCEGTALKITVDASGRKAYLTQMIKARSLRGKIIKLSGFYKCDTALNINLTAWAGKQNNHRYFSSVDLCDMPEPQAQNIPAGWRYFHKQLTVPVEAINLQISLPAPEGQSTSYMGLQFKIGGQNESSSGKQPVNLELTL